MYAFLVKNLTLSLLQSTLSYNCIQEENENNNRENIKPITKCLLGLMI